MNRGSPERTPALRTKFMKLNGPVHANYSECLNLFILSCTVYSVSIASVDHDYYLTQVPTNIPPNQIQPSKNRTHQHIRRRLNQNNNGWAIERKRNSSPCR